MNGEAGQPNMRRIVVFLSFVGICSLAIWAAPSEINPEKVVHWYSIIPPLLAVTLALWTRKLLFSLVISILVGGFLSQVPLNAGSIGAWGSGIITGPGYMLNSVKDTYNIQILLFVFLVMAMISVLLITGGLKGVVQWLAKFAKNARSTQISTALMGFAIFIDDYANTMMVGSSLRPLSDRYKVSREKLAFLVDATSAPIAGVAVISTWIGYEIGLFGKQAESFGIPTDGYSMFFDALAFRFYCLLMIAFVLANVFFGLDFGPMRKAQKRASEEGKVIADDATPMTSRSFGSVEAHKEAQVSGWTAVLPFVGLFGYLIIGLWLDGGGAAKFSESATSFFSFSVWREVISASENNILILAYGAGVGLGVACLAGLFISKVSFSTLLVGLKSGAKAAILPCVILVMAWSLKGACDDLKTGQFLVATIGKTVSPLWFPAVVFIVAGLTSFATGTSWGTMAILIPTCFPIAYELDGGSYGLVTMICLGAVLDGAIFGDHCSPISDTTIMSSIASSCDHIHHVRTQLPYSLTVAGIALVFGYLPAAFGVSSLVSLGIGVIVIVGLFFGLRLREGVKQQVEQAV